MSELPSPQGGDRVEPIFYASFEAVLDEADSQ